MSNVNQARTSRYSDTALGSTAPAYTAPGLVITESRTNQQRGERRRLGLCGRRLTADVASGHERRESQSEPPLRPEPCATFGRERVATLAAAATARDKAVPLAAAQRLVKQPLTGRIVA